MEQMKIKIKDSTESISITGSNILRLYPDHTTPILDLFVRESLQNSLDATNNKNSFVQVDYKIGNFDTNSLCNTLETISDSLRRMIGNNKSSYISVRDKYTVGLTGSLSKSEVTNYEYGNLVKLVYDICNPQDTAGAGGSWGLGKTIYFRLGIGLVFYYSRIFNYEKNSYESRLAGCLFENEKSENTLLPKEWNGMSSGIAWWGEITENMSSRAITDDNYINHFLDIFGIKPFDKEETGTEIIIPFINEEKILLYNRVYERDEDRPYWTKSLDDYLNIAVQRWYFTRLNNSKYNHGNGPYLKVFINGIPLRKSNMLPLFRIGQILYNKAASLEVSDYLDDHPLNIHVEDICINKDLEDTLAGRLATVICDNEDLGMTPPNNNNSPYNYLDLEEEGEDNPSILTFCRKPGMLVSHIQNDSKWLKNVPPRPNGEYCLSIFVLNSDNRLNDEVTDLEEYIRGSEMANHNSWEDHHSRTIIDRIKKNCAKRLNALYNVQKNEEDDERVDSGLGRFLADLVLPPLGFGNLASRNNNNRRPTVKRTNFTTHRSLSYGLKPNSTKYNSDTVTFTYVVKAASTPIQSFDIYALISSESSDIKAQQWEDSGMTLPFGLKDITIKTSDKTKISPTYDWLKTTGNQTYGIRVMYTEKVNFELDITFCLEIKSKNLQPIIKAETTE